MEQLNYESDYSSSENESGDETDTFSNRLYKHLAKNPTKYDKTFVIGKEKETVNALGIVLEVNSPVLNTLMSGKSKDDIIELPDVDPAAFRILLKLLPSDQISVQALTDLKLSAQDLFSLISICEKFGIKRIHRNLEIVADTIFKHFEAFIQSEDFIRLSKINLEAVLSSDRIWLEHEILIFQGVYRWAEAECSRMHIKCSGENIRQVLGNCLNLIRFPIMSNEQLANIVCPKQILTSKEELDIFKYISSIEKNKAEFDMSTLQFDTRKRCTVMSFLRGLTIVNFPTFVCDAEDLDNDFQIDSKIMVYSVGFLGPINRDSVYLVEMGIQRYNSSSSSLCGKVEKRVLAKKRKIFHIKFDHAIILKPNRSMDDWDDYYRIWFTLRGADTQTVEDDDSDENDDDVTESKVFNLQFDGVNFKCSWRSKQVAQLRFKKA